MSAALTSSSARRRRVHESFAWFAVEGLKFKDKGLGFRAYDLSLRV